MLDLPTDTFNAYKLQGLLFAIMDLETCYMASSVKLKNQLKIYFKKAFDLFLDLPQASTTNKTNDLILNLTPENVTQHSRIE